jgi:hypothetical protein
MSTAFNMIAEILQEEAEGGHANKQRSTPVDTIPDGETLDRIAMLLRKGVMRGIHPQWSLRKALNVQSNPEALQHIASQIEEGFTSGEAPFDWRIDVYE